MIILSFLIELFKSLFFFTASYSNNLFPDPLTDEEEAKYLDLMSKGESFARNKLIEHNLRLVAHIVKKYASSGGHQLYKIDEVIDDEIVIRTVRAQGDLEDEDN